MIEYQGWPPTTKISQGLEQADLLLSQLRENLRTGRAPEALSPDQRTALTQAKAALESYLSYFYPHKPGQGDASSE